jgi:hypothetical protein
MNLQATPGENICHEYSIKPMCLKISFEERVSKNHKMLFLIHKKALETSVFPNYFIDFISTSFCFFSSYLFSFFHNFSASFLHMKNRSNSYAEAIGKIQQQKSFSIAYKTYKINGDNICQNAMT